MDAKPSRGEPRGRYLASLSLAALGVVYGDIGTSVPYAVRESSRARDRRRPAQPGVLSLIFTVMSRNARTATSFFGLPPNRVVELGAQIRL